MLPLRLIIDTNVVVSAALRPSGLQRTVFLLAITKPSRWYVSPLILEEYRQVLARPELRIRRGLRVKLFQLIKNHGYSINPTALPQITVDPDDNKFVECADAARADYLVTGNQKHFPKYWKQSKIITPRELVNLVAPHLAHRRKSRLS